MGKKEVWRDFEGKLDVTNRDGTIVYELDEWYEVETLSIVEGTKTYHFRFRKPEIAPDWDTFDFSGMYNEVELGGVDGQVLVRSKWYTPRKMINQYKDVQWRRHI